MSNTTKTRVAVYFYECEHGGDLAAYADGLREMGASVVTSKLGENDTGCVEIDVTGDLAAFKAKCKDTDCGDFIRGWRVVVAG